MRRFLWFKAPDARPDRLLENLAKDKRQVLAEVEHHNLRLRTVLAIRGRKVVLARPRELPRPIPRGSWIRLYHPGLPDSGFRMMVISPHFRLTNGSSAVITELPSELVHRSVRSAERYDTSRFPGLRVVFPELQVAYPVIDISLKGCRLNAEAGWPWDSMPRNRPIYGTVLEIGKQRVSLSSLVPRVRQEQGVGCEIAVSSIGQSARIFRHFIAKLEKDETTRNRLEPTV